MFSSGEEVKVKCDHNNLPAYSSNSFSHYCDGTVLAVRNISGDGAVYSVQIKFDTGWVILPISSSANILEPSLIH